jgi:O-antigen ligase
VTARLGGLAATVVVTVGFLLLLFGGGLWVGIYVSDVRLALVLYGGAASAGWLVLAQVRPRWLPRSGLAGAVAASLLAFAISGALAPQPRLGFEYLAYGVLLTALYLMLVRVWRDATLRRRLDALVIVVTILAALGYVVEVGSSWVAYWQLIGGLAVPELRPSYAGLWLGNPNALASLLVLLSLTVAAATGAATRARRVGLGGLGVVVAFDVLLSGSRGSWLGVALAAVVGIVVWLSIGTNRVLLRSIAGHPRVRAGALALLAGAVVGGVLFAPAIASRLQAGAVESRTAFWAATVRMIEDRPFTGLGPGSWAPARVAYTVAPELDAYVPHAHNVPLQVASELGIVGIVAGAVVVVALARLVRRGLANPAAEPRALAWATLLGTVYLFGQSLVDAYTHQPAILLALALPIARLDAWITAEEAEPSGRDLRARRWLAAILLAAVVLSTLAAAGVEGPARSVERAAAAANGGDWVSALAMAGPAAVDDPRLAPHLLLRGLAAAHADDLEAAESSLAAAAALDDYAPTWVDLAAVRLRRGDESGARAALASALRLGYQHPPIAAAAAGLYRDLGDADAAADALAWAWAGAPSMASDPAWQAPEWRDIAGRAELIARERADGTWNGFVLALELEDTAAALALADELGGVTGEDARLGALAWRGDESAFESLHARARARPNDGAVVGLCRRVADVGRSRGEDAWACDGVAPTDAYPVVRVGTPLLDQVMPGRGVYFHAPYAFRRVLPQDLLVPWLVRLSATNP